MVVGWWLGCTIIIPFIYQTKSLHMIHMCVFIYVWTVNNTPQLQCNEKYFLHKSYREQMSMPGTQLLSFYLTSSSAWKKATTKIENKSTAQHPPHKHIKATWKIITIFCCCCSSYSFTLFSFQLSSSSLVVWTLYEKNTEKMQTAFYIAQRI